MTGATDFFFGLVLMVLAVGAFLFVMFSVLDKIFDWQYERKIKMARPKVLAIFDEQLRYLMDPANNRTYARNPVQKKKEFENLRENLAISVSWMSDVLEFEKKGAPLLLVFPQYGDVSPYVLVGISGLSDEVKLSEGSVLGQQPYPRKERNRLVISEGEWLEVFYPSVAIPATYCNRLDVDLVEDEQVKADEADSADKGRC